MRIARPPRRHPGIRRDCSQANSGHDHGQSWSTFLCVGTRSVHNGQVPRILARIPPAESPLTLTPTSRSPKSDPRTRRCRVGGSDCVLGSWMSFCELEEHWDSRKTFRSLWLRTGFDSLQTSSEVSFFIYLTPKNHHQNVTKIISEMD